jgi:hypothetical protein
MSGSSVRAVARPSKLYAGISRTCQSIARREAGRGLLRNALVCCGRGQGAPPSPATNLVPHRGARQSRPAGPRPTDQTLLARRQNGPARRQRAPDARVARRHPSERPPRWKVRGADRPRRRWPRGRRACGPTGPALDLAEHLGRPGWLHADGSRRPRRHQGGRCAPPRTPTEARPRDRRQTHRPRPLHGRFLGSRPPND